MHVTCWEKRLYNNTLPSRWATDAEPVERFLVHSFVQGGRTLAPFWPQRLDLSLWSQPPLPTGQRKGHPAPEETFLDSHSDKLRGLRTLKWRLSPPRQLQESLWNIALSTIYFAAASIKELNCVWVAAISTRAKLDFSLENKLQTTSLLCRHSLTNMYKKYQSEKDVFLLWGLIKKHLIQSGTHGWIRNGYSV